MAYYAFLDENNAVTEVIQGNDEGGDVDWEQHYSEIRGQPCKRTSFNTQAGKNPLNRPFRKNFAGIGYIYDVQRDAFVAPQPYASWLLDEQTCSWIMPELFPGGMARWDEGAREWIAVADVAGP